MLPLGREEASPLPTLQEEPAAAVGGGAASCEPSPGPAPAAGGEAGASKSLTGMRSARKTFCLTCWLRPEWTLGLSTT
eukprot:7143530-Alexandrium_andersonii.AAC.1